jgi:hypothetical protein
LNLCFAGFAEGEIQQGKSSPLEGEEIIVFPDGNSLVGTASLTTKLAADTFTVS